MAEDQAKLDNLSTASNEGGPPKATAKAAKSSGPGVKSGPARPGTKPGDTPGGMLERRAARLEFAEGAFVRLRVPVSSDGSDPSRDVITDVDVLSVDVDSRLRVSRSSLECKSGKGQSGEPYTLVWLAGFRQLLDLDRVTLVRQTVSGRGRALAKKLGISVADEQSISDREPAHAWLPERFAHLDGPGCINAEARTDSQLKGLPGLPAPVTKFLRGSSMLADSVALLSAVDAFGKGVAKQGGVPEPAATVLASHALIAIILAGVQDAGRLNDVSASVLRERLSRALTVGDADDIYLLPLLERADALVRYFQDQTHKKYVEAGADPIRFDYPSLKSLIAEPPNYLDDYLDFVLRLRSNPQISRDLLQTAELLCFDALMGDRAWQAPAFAHLFTTEHHGLISVAIRCLSSIAGRNVADVLEGLNSIRHGNAGSVLVDRRVPSDFSVRQGHRYNPRQPELDFDATDGPD